MYLFASARSISKESCIVFTGTPNWLGPSEEIKYSSFSMKRVSLALVRS